METQALENVAVQTAESEPKKNRQKNSKGVIASRIVAYAVLILYTLWILLPFLIILETSFVPKSEFRDAEHYIWWPENPTLAGYVKLFTKDPYMVGGIPSLLRGIFNTMWITLIPLFSSLLQSALVAYVYSRYEFPAKNTLFMITVTLMFVPLGAVGFTSYMFYQNIGWTTGSASVLPLIVLGLFAGAGTVFFLRPYMEGINKEIIEAAEIDGMGFWQVFFAIVLPRSSRRSSSGLSAAITTMRARSCICRGKKNFGRCKSPCRKSSTIRRAARISALSAQRRSWQCCRLSCSILPARSSLSKGFRSVAEKNNFARKNYEDKKISLRRDRARFVARLPCGLRQRDA